MEKADAEEQEFWTRVINANQKNDDDLDHAIALMRKHKALEQSMGLAQDYADKALESISIAPDGELKDLLKALIKFTINREY